VIASALAFNRFIMAFQKIIYAALEGEESWLHSLQILGITWFHDEILIILDLPIGTRSNHGASPKINRTWAGAKIRKKSEPGILKAHQQIYYSKLFDNSDYLFWSIIISVFANKLALKSLSSINFVKTIIFISSSKLGISTIFSLFWIIIRRFREYISSKCFSKYPSLNDSFKS